MGNLDQQTDQQTEKQVEPIETEQAVNTENAEPSNQEDQQPERTFTQKELDEIIQKRLERERESVSKKVAQEARDAWIAEQGWKDFDGNPITTEQRYREVLKEQEIRDKYKDKVDDDVLQELVESKKFREKYEAERAESEKRAKQESDFKEFLSAFPDVEAADIPAEVWEEVDKGKSLVDAYTRYENKRLKDELAKLTEQKKIEEKNEENAASSTGSVTGQGTEKPAFFTAKQVEKMSKEEVNRNWTAINESMKNPKFYE